MISLSKILTLIVILVAVWYGFRLIGRFQKQRIDALRRNGGADANAKRPATKGAAASQDMVKCAVCGVYTAPDGGKCGTPGCPR